MWSNGKYDHKGYGRFFYLTLCHDNLKNWYTVNFILNQDFNMSLSEIENMIPFEREIFVYMILNRVEEEKKKSQQ